MQASEPVASVPHSAAACGIDPAIERGIQALASLSIPSRRAFAIQQLSPVIPRLAQNYLHTARGKFDRAVLFVSHKPHSRETRLADAARHGGWTPYLIALDQPKSAPAGTFADVIVVHDPLQLVLFAWLFPGRIVHGFGLKGDVLYILARLKPAVLVIDLYDTSAGTKSDSEAQKAQEAFVLKTADAATHRDTRLNRLKRLYRQPIPSQNLFIHDPITQRATRPPRQDGKIKVISTGWLGEGDNSILRTVTALLDDGIHVCLVLNPTQGMDYPMVQPYLELASRYPHLSVREPVFGEAYWNLLQEYDFGMAISEPSIFSEPLTEFTDDAMQNCGSSRLVDYIAAGLGVIGSPGLHFQNFISRRFAATHVVADVRFLASPTKLLQLALENKRQKDVTALTSQRAGARLGTFYTEALRTDLKKRTVSRAGARSPRAFAASTK